MVWATPMLKERSRDGAEPAVVLVLGNSDLLAEILLRLGFPTCLVRAAVVCRRWLRCASDPAFLRRFRALHPPRILGICVTCRRGGDYPILFFPVPQPRELAAVATRAAEALQATLELIDHCWNGRMLVVSSARTNSYLAVRSLLQPGPGKPLPPTPDLILKSRASFGFTFRYHYRLLLEHDGDATSCLLLYFARSDVEFIVDFFILQAGVWGGQGSAVTDLLHRTPSKNVLGDPFASRGKVYMLTDAGCILVLDLSTSSFSTVDLPQGTGHRGTTRLSHAQQYGLYLIDVAEFCLRVWHGDGVGQWVLVDTISVREACARMNVQKWECDDGNRAPVWIVGAGDNAEFVVLELVASGVFCCMQLANRVVEKMADNVPRTFFADFTLVSMVWPPIFPVLEQASEEH